MHYPFFTVPGGYLRADYILHVTAVDGDPDYLEMLLLGGHREIYRRDEIPNLLRWITIQADHQVRAQAAMAAYPMSEEG